MNHSTYRFTDDWFSRHTPVWSKLLDSLRPSNILEIGSYEGRSACFLLEACAKLNEVILYCVDTWTGGMEHETEIMNDVEKRFDHNVAIAKSRAKNLVQLRKMKARSSTALAELMASGDKIKFDLIHVDGSHQAVDVLTDAVMSFSLLRTGGLMIFDDYLWNMEFCGDKDLLNTPKLAIDSFCNVFHNKIKIIRGVPLYQLYVQKTSE